MDSTSFCSPLGPDADVSCQTLTSPVWESSFALSTFLIYSFPPSSFHFFPTFHSVLMNLLCVIIAPLAKRTGQAYPPLTPSVLPSSLTSPGLIRAGMLSFLKTVDPVNSVVCSWMSAQRPPPQEVNQSWAEGPVSPNPDTGYQGLRVWGGRSEPAHPTPVEMEWVLYERA